MKQQMPHLIVNPAAGRGRAGKHVPRILELLAQAGVTPELHISDATGDIENLVRSLLASDARTLLIAGGDGSVHEAVNGILGSRSDAAFGVIPVGTGNDFAKAAGIPADWVTATRLLADRLTSNASPRRIDAGRMNERFFANGAGIGFDATVTRYASEYRLPIGDLVYLLGIFRAMANGVATPTMTIRCNDIVWDAPLTLVAISNGPWVGGMFHIAPMAQHADGLLELLIAAPVTRRRILRLLPKLVQGTHMGEQEITHHTITRVQIDSSAPLASQLDGEVQPLQQQFEIEVLPAALRLL